MDDLFKSIAYGLSIGAIFSGVIYAYKSISPMKKEIKNHDDRIVELEKDSSSYKTSLTHFTTAINDLNITLRDTQKSNIEIYKLIIKKMK